MIALTACDPTQSYERATDGSTVYLDQLSEAAKAEAREKIKETLSRGVGTYQLGIGDEIQILFHISRKATARPYVIAASDKLRIEFLGDTDNSRTVQVLPDGRVSLPLIGPVMAAGQTAEALARQLQQRYSHVLTEPKITVNVTEAHSPLDDFIDALGASAKGRNLDDKVLPDGTIALPRLPPMLARGRTMQQLTDDIDRAYAAKGLDVAVSLLPRTLRANAAMVIGEVTTPGRVELQRPTTVAMAVARVGGALPTGATSSVRLFYIADDGTPRVRSINLDEVLEDFRLENDMIVPRNSIIYVPPTALAKTSRFMTAVARDILRFQGFSIGGGYNLQ